MKSLQLRLRLQPYAAAEFMSLCMSQSMQVQETREPPCLTCTNKAETDYLLLLCAQVAALMKMCQTGQGFQKSPAAKRKKLTLQKLTEHLKQF